MRLLFVSGGSGGHIMPMLAVWQAIQERAPATEIHFLCTDTPSDAETLSRSKMSFTVSPVPRRSLLLPLGLLRAFAVARRVLHDFRPDVVFSKGGAVSIPVCFLAHLRGIPIVLHESDAVMGRANRIVARWAKVILTGENPIRKEVLHGNRTQGLKITGFSGTRKVLLVIGGSQGAEALNRAVRNSIKELTSFCDVIHITGKGKTGADMQKGYWSTEFAMTELPHLYAIADIALSRAGAGSISELAAWGIPMILVPIRGLAQDHQMVNAIRTEENGACTILLQEDLNQKLVGLVKQFVTDEAKRSQMSAASRALHHQGAALRIAESIFQCVARRAETH